MKLLVGLLMTMLAVVSLGAERGTVSGVLKCDEPFYAYVKLMEVDGLLYGRDDQIGDPQEFQPKWGQFEVAFSVSGEASDPLDGVEPRLVIQHTCGGTTAWLCKDYPTQYYHFGFREVIDLKNNFLFYNCDDSHRR